MYNPLLETIFTTYEENFSLEPDYTIEFYEANNSSFTEMDEFDREYLFKYGIISSKYIAALVQKKRYQKAISQSETILAIIDRNEARLNIKHPINGPYNGIIYQRGMAKYRSFIFKSALRDFTFLLKNEPLNNNVKRWYVAAKYEYYAYLSLAIGLSTFIISKVFHSHLPKVINIIILMAGFICCLTCMGLTAVKNVKLKNIPRQ